MGGCPICRIPFEGFEFVRQSVEEREEPCALLSRKNTAAWKLVATLAAVAVVSLASNVPYPLQTPWLQTFQRGNKSIIFYLSYSPSFQDLFEDRDQMKMLQPLIDESDVVFVESTAYAFTSNSQKALGGKKIMNSIPLKQIIELSRPSFLVVHQPVRVANGIDISDFKACQNALNLEKYIEFQNLYPLCQRFNLGQTIKRIDDLSSRRLFLHEHSSNKKTFSSLTKSFRQGYRTPVMTILLSS